MANKPLKTLNFGGEDTYVLTPDWENIDNTPFGETTVMGDTLTWDGNTEGLYSVLGMFYHVSDSIPTMEEAQQGGSLIFQGSEVEFTSSDIMDLETLGAGSGCYLIAPGGNYCAGVALEAGATATMQGVSVTFEKAGTYFMYNAAVSSNFLTTSLTINNYTDFETTEIKTIDPKYLPSGEPSIVFTMENYTVNSPRDSVVTCNKTYAEIVSMTYAELGNAIAMPVDDDINYFYKTTCVRIVSGMGVAFDFIGYDSVSSLIYPFTIALMTDGSAAVQ